MAWLTRQDPDDLRKRGVRMPGHRIHAQIGRWDWRSPDPSKRRMPRCRESAARRLIQRPLDDAWGPEARVFDARVASASTTMRGRPDATKVHSAVYDVVVIGGGIVGTGIAREASVRGLSVAIFEKDDFAAGTTSRSTRLVHGGFRYLENLEFGLVREALRERGRLLANAPHLVQPQPFLMPVYRRRGHPFLTLWAGMILYDLLNAFGRLPRHRLLGPRTCRDLEPAVRSPGLRGGFVFYDAQCRHPERLCVENLVDAQRHHALVQNHVAVVDVLRDGDHVLGVRVQDQFTQREQDVRARVVVNASGPWLDEVLDQAEIVGPSLVRRSKGVHLVTHGFTRHALIMETEDARRVFFAIPWGEYTLLGTTDTEYTGDNENVHADDNDVDYLLREARRILRVDLTRRHVLFTTAGLRALPSRTGLDVGKLSRRHTLVDHEETTGLRGLYSVIGGKITTYREIAEDVVDQLVKANGLKRHPGTTRKRRLPGAPDSGSWKTHRRTLVRRAMDLGLDRACGDHLATLYGVRAAWILDLIQRHPELGRRIVAARPEVMAEVDHAVKREWAQTAEDVLLRRTTLGLSQGLGWGALEAVIGRMTTLLHWDAARIARERTRYRARIEGMGPSPVLSHASVGSGL